MKKILFVVVAVCVLAIAAGLANQPQNQTQIYYSGNIGLYDPVVFNVLSDKPESLLIKCSLHRLNYSTTVYQMAPKGEYPEQLTMSINGKGYALQIEQTEDYEYDIEMVIETEKGWNEISFYSPHDGKMYLTILAQ